VQQVLLAKVQQSFTAKVQQFVLNQHSVGKRRDSERRYKTQWVKHVNTLCDGSLLFEFLASLGAITLARNDDDLGVMRQAIQAR
jgi:hypothetical protein